MHRGGNLDFTQLNQGTRKKKGLWCKILGGFPETPKTGTECNSGALLQDDWVTIIFVQGKAHNQGFDIFVRSTFNIFLCDALPFILSTIESHT